MIAIDLPAPHGFLVWRGKQTAIGNSQPWPADEKLAVVSNGEVYGEVVLGLPAAMTVTEFDRLADEHCVRPEERKLWWNGVEELYVQRVKEFEPYHQLKACKVEGGELILLDEPELDDGCKALLGKTDRLPKVIVLKEDVITLSGTEVKSDVDANIGPVVEATFDTFDLGNKALPLYHLALVRISNMRFREKQEETMPYGKVQREGRWCVENTQTGEVKECYDDEGQADALLTALNLNVEDKKKEGEVTEPPEEADKAVWSTAFVNSLPDASFLYIEPGGDKDEENRTVPRTLRHFPYKDADGAIDLPHLRNALARIPQSSLSGTLKTRLTNEATAILERQNKGEKAGRRMAARMMDRLREAWQTMKDILTWAEYDGDMPPEPDDEMKAIGVKQVNGQLWFFAHSTNAFQDREAEIFSTAALEQYVNQAEAQGERGFFNFWHIPGTDFAKKEWQGVIGRVLVEAGPFLDNDLGQKAQKFFEEFPASHPDIAPEGWGCSPEYRYLPEERKGGIYSNIWITRTSALPRLAAANIWTKGGIMALNDQQRKAAAAIFGEELANQIIATAERQTKELEEAGVAHKEAPPAEPEKQDAPPMETPPAEKPDNGLMEKLSEMADGMMAGMGAMAGKLDELSKRVDALEGSSKMAAAVETPRWLTSAFERAALSNKTVVAEDDPLKEQKPAETTPKKEGAAAFFSNRK